MAASERAALLRAVRGHLDAGRLGDALFALMQSPEAVAGLRG